MNSKILILKLEMILNKFKLFHAYYDNSQDHNELDVIGEIKLDLINLKNEIEEGKDVRSK